MAIAAGIASDVEPQEIGFDPVRLERLEHHLQRYVERGLRVGCQIAIARGGRVGYVHSVGQRDAVAGLPVESDTIWRVYSMTKPLVSVAAMMLWEEGLLALGAPVASYLPSFESPRVYRVGPARAPLTAPASETMLVRHLLSHTSGLSYGFMYSNAVDEALRLQGFDIGQPENYTLAELCDRVAALPLVFEPGSEWNYSYSTDVVGRIVEIVSGQSLEDFLQSRILRPLGMVDTGYTVSNTDLGRVSALYSFDPESGRAVPKPELDAPLDGPRLLKGGGHGLVSTAADYLRFLQLLLRGGELDGVRLLAPRTVALMTSNQLPDGHDIFTYARPTLLSSTQRGVGFGLGFSVLLNPVAADTTASPGTFGWGGAAGTEFWVDPAEELTVVFMTQVLFAADDLRAELRRLVYQALVS